MRSISGSSGAHASSSSSSRTSPNRGPSARSPHRGTRESTTTSWPTRAPSHGRAPGLASTARRQGRRHGCRTRPIRRLYGLGSRLATAPRRSQERDRDMFLFLVDGNRDLHDPTDTSTPDCSAGSCSGTATSAPPPSPWMCSCCGPCAAITSSGDCATSLAYGAGMSARRFIEAWTTSLDAVSTRLDASLVDDRAMLLRAASQEPGSTREQVIEAAMQGLDLSRKHASDAYAVAEQHESNPRSVWGTCRDRHVSANARPGRTPGSRSIAPPAASSPVQRPGDRRRHVARLTPTASQGRKTRST
jgi:hypothetical protein